MGSMPGGWHFDSAWDAGEAGCGEFLLELRDRMRALSPGAILVLTRSDPGAPIEIPAWCRVTGNTLLGCEPPHYLILRKAS